MKASIQPSRLNGRLSAPASKSSMQRALALAWITQKECTIFDPGHSADDKAAMGIISDLGALIEKQEDRIIIRPSGLPPKEAIHCGESGLSIRMFTPLAALLNRPIRITGEGSLVSRPMDLFEKILPQLGVKVQTNQGKLPLVVEGPLKPASIEVDGSLSSQFLTGLLMAYAATGAKDVTIKVKDLKSKPYIGLTIDMIHEFGLAAIDNRNYEAFFFGSPLPRKEHYDYRVEGDWSSAAFLLVAGAIAGPVHITGLHLASSQADRAILQALMQANASLAVEAKGIKIRPAPMKAFEFDATDCPDLFPPLVALAANCQGESRIKGCERLRHKESDRAHSLQEEFGKMGIRVEVEADLMRVMGGEVRGALVHSHHDHRIAMACAVAALNAKEGTVISDAEAVNKSYPDFFDDLKKLGAAVSLDNKIKWHE